MSTPTLSMIPTKQIAAGEENPRGKVDTRSEAFKELCASIKARGILQPILVGPSNGDGKHSVVAGYRRYAAATKLKLSEIPAMVLDLDGAELLAALTENIQREGLSPVAEAKAIKQLQGDHGFTQVQAGDALGKSERWVRERLRLLRIPERTQEAYDKGDLPIESLVEVEKIAKAAPKAADALAQAAGANEDIRQAIGVGRVAEALEWSTDDLDDVGCLLRIRKQYDGGCYVNYFDLEDAGAPADRLKAIKERSEYGKELGRKTSLYMGSFDGVRFGGADIDAANSYGCLLSLDGHLYITDGEWLADRFAERLEKDIADAEKQLKREGKATKASASDDEEAAKERRRKERAAELKRREEARAANLELGQRTERALRSARLSLDEAKLLALMVVDGGAATDLGSRGLIYCYHDYQDEEHLKNGSTKVTYSTGRAAGDDLVKAIHAAKKPEEALTLALRALLLANFADQECVAQSRRSWWSVPADEGKLELLQAIACKRKVLPEALKG